MKENGKRREVKELGREKGRRGKTSRGRDGRGEAVVKRR